MSTPCREPCAEAAIQAVPCTCPCSKAVGTWILAATILGSSMAFIDGTVVNVILPVLQQETGASVAGLQWVVESYALFLASLLLVGGSLGDQFGRRRMFGLGVAIFAVASLACGLAGNIEMLIAARAVQGIGGALLVPGSLALIGAAFRDEERGRAIGTWSACTAITAAIGPVVGGWLVENVSWRWAFFINVPLAAIVLLIVVTRVPESRDEGTSRDIDWLGASLVTLGLGAIVYGLIEAPTLGFAHPLVFGTILLACVLLAASLAVAARQQQPTIPLHLFRSRTFAGANLLTLLLYAALGGGLFFLPFNLIQAQGYSATAAGASFLPLVLLISLLSRWAGGLADRYGARRLLAIGALVAASGYALLAVPGVGGSFWTTFFPGVVVLGLGMAISIAPLTTTVMGSIEARFAGRASGINNAVSRTAGLLAVAGFGIVISAVFGNSLNDRLRLVELPEASRIMLEQQRSRLAAATIPEELDEESRVKVREALAYALVDGFRLVMVVCVALCVAGAVVVMLLIGGPVAANGRRRSV